MFLTIFFFLFLFNEAQSHDDCMPSFTTSKRPRYIIIPGPKVIYPKSVARLNRAESVLNRELSEKQAQGILKAHKVGRGEIGRNGRPAKAGNYTTEQLLRKTRILKQSGFTSEEIRTLMENKVVGSSSDEQKEAPAEKPLAETDGTETEVEKAFREAERTIQLEWEKVYMKQEGTSDEQREVSDEEALTEIVEDDPISRPLIFRMIEGELIRKPLTVRTTASDQIKEPVTLKMIEEMSLNQLKKVSENQIRDIMLQIKTPSEIVAIVSRYEDITYRQRRVIQRAMRDLPVDWVNLTKEETQTLIQYINSLRFNEVSSIPPELITAIFPELVNQIFPSVIHFMDIEQVKALTSEQKKSFSAKQTWELWAGNLLSRIDISVENKDPSSTQ